MIGVTCHHSGIVRAVVMNVRVYLSWVFSAEMLQLTNYQSRSYVTMTTWQPNGGRVIIITRHCTLDNRDSGYLPETGSKPCSLFLAKCAMAWYQTSRTCQLDRLSFSQGDSSYYNLYEDADPANFRSLDRCPISGMGWGCHHCVSTKGYHYITVTAPFPNHHDLRIIFLNPATIHYSLLSGCP